VVVERAKMRERQTLLAASAEEGVLNASKEREVAKTKVLSSTLTSFTEAAFFKRVAGDLDQVVDGHAPGRVHFGCLVNLDEGYKFLKMLGLVVEKKGGSRDVADHGAPPDAASEFNKLMQTGTASLTTKTSGSFGEGGSPAISLGIAGNAHPSMIIPMLRGKLGANHAAAAERVLMVSARPVDPHTPVPDFVEYPLGHARWKWPRLLHANVEHLGMKSAWMDAQQAAALLQKARHDGQERCDSDDDNEEDAHFVPDASGYRVELADGTPSRLRFRRVADRAVPEFRVPNRDLPLPEQWRENVVVQRLTTYFDKPHMQIPMSAAAQLTLQGLSTAFTVQCSIARDAADVMRAAMLGAGPWHMAMLAAGLLLLEIGFGDYDNDPAYASKTVDIKEGHVVRAFDLFVSLLEQRRVWQEGPAAQPAGIPRDAEEQARAASEAQRQRAVANRPVGVDGYSDFAMTQAASAREPHEAEGDAAASASRTQVRCLVPTDAEIPDMETGYGPNGESVQREEDGPIFMSDRQIMRATLLRGEAVIYGRDVCGSVSDRTPRSRAGQKRSRVSLRQTHWKNVMKAGLAKYRIGDYVDEGAALPPYRTGQAYVRLAFPPDGNVALATEYSNRLMKLCQVTYAQVVEAAVRKSEKKRVSDRAPNTGDADGSAQAEQLVAEARVAVPVAGDGVAAAGDGPTLVPAPAAGSGGDAVPVADGVAVAGNSAVPAHVPASPAMLGE
jgi:hypothetical protein